MAPPHLPHRDRALFAPPWASLLCLSVPEPLTSPNSTCACVPPALYFKPDSIKVNNNTRKELTLEGKGGQKAEWPQEAMTLPPGTFAH